LATDVGDLLKWDGSRLINLGPMDVLDAQLVYIQKNNLNGKPVDVILAASNASDWKVLLVCAPIQGNATCSLFTMHLCFAL
jgi:hypothetical protein